MATAEAYQRIIADRERAKNPRERLTSMDGFYVAPITKAQAQPLIKHYEWKRDIGNAKHFVGLFTPDHELVGASCFGTGPNTIATMRNLLRGDALCLERRACVHYLPENAVSFQTIRACKLMYEKTGIARYFAYADPEAGEYGGIYQASNCLYLGQGLTNGRGRTER
jgi:hypothetical protein